MSLTVSLVFLLFISGVVAQDGWAVNYNPKSICALKGSTVTMSCTYMYPNGYWVRKAFWTKELGRGSEPPDLSDDPEYRGRVQYLGNKQHSCTLRLKNVREKDQSKYYCRFITDQPGGKYQGKDGVDLSVRDLQVEVPDRVIEGDKVTLTCRTTCSLTVRSTLTWYRNGHRLSSSTDTDQLHLQPVSREDAGRYHCAVWSQNLRSPEVTLNVRYGPKGVSVSISPSGETVEGSSVTLTCSSDAESPVEYNWFKGTSLVAEGETYTMNKISSVDSGEYKCKCSNGYIVKYSAVTVNVLYPPKNISVSISPSGEILEGSSVTLTCSSDANPPVQNYTWFKKLNKGTQKSTSQIYNISNISSADSGEYQCMVANTQGSRYAEYKSITVLYAPKKAQASISETAEGSSVTLTCSSDANPPVQIYTWFKEGGSSPVGSGHSYRALQSGSYYCVAQNEHGNQKSVGVSVTVKGVWNEVLYAVLGVVAVGCLFAIIAVLCVRRKRKHDSANYADQKQENIYSNVAVGAATNDRAPDPDLSNQDDVYYASAVPRARNPESAFGTDEEVKYASIQFRCDKVIEKTEGDSTEYAKVRFTHASANNRSSTSMTEDPSVIYSTIE